MGIQFNLQEVFEMAEQIERNGARFYRRAAEIHADPEARVCLLKLASMEDEHELIFRRLREELLGEAGGPGGTASPYLHEWVDGYVFDSRSDPAEWLSESASLADIIRRAIGLEKDSIIFYLGLKDHLPPRFGHGKIEAIIEQEMTHITSLNKKLAGIHR